MARALCVLFAGCGQKVDTNATAAPLHLSPKALYRALFGAGSPGAAELTTRTAALGDSTFRAYYDALTARASNQPLVLDEVVIERAADRLRESAPLFDALDGIYPRIADYWRDTGMLPSTVQKMDESRFVEALRVHLAHWRTGQVQGPPHPALALGNTGSVLALGCAELFSSKRHVTVPVTTVPLAELGFDPGQFPTERRLRSPVEVTVYPTPDAVAWQSPSGQGTIYLRAELPTDTANYIGSLNAAFAAVPQKQTSKYTEGSGVKAGNYYIRKTTNSQGGGETTYRIRRDGRPIGTVGVSGDGSRCTELSPGE